jgi:hypothetical protein
MPGAHVPDWTERPQVAEDLLPLWSSFCEFCGWPEHGLDAVLNWVAIRWRHEPESARGLIADVFVDLLSERRRLLDAKAAASATPEGAE